MRCPECKHRLSIFDATSQFECPSCKAKLAAKYTGKLAVAELTLVCIGWLLLFYGYELARWTGVAIVLLLWIVGETFIRRSWMRIEAVRESGSG